jgi:hypothetical protein
MFEMRINHLARSNRKRHSSVIGCGYGVADTWEGMIWNISDIHLQSPIIYIGINVVVLSSFLSGFD